MWIKSEVLDVTPLKKNRKCVLNKHEEISEIQWDHHRCYHKAIRKFLAIVFFGMLKRQALQSDATDIAVSIRYAFFPRELF